MVRTPSLFLGWRRHWGGYGFVDLVHHKQYGVVAYKNLHSLSIEDNKLTELIKEAALQQRLDHLNIVTLIDTHFDSRTCGMFLEYMKFGTVFDFVRQFEVSWAWKIQILYDVALGMSHLHGQHPVVIHGDLKCQNILIGDGFCAKISDFVWTRPNGNRLLQI